MKNNQTVIPVDGSNKKTKRKPFKLSRKVFSYPYILFMLIFVVLPLIMILLNAFLVNGEFSLQNFEDFFTESSSMEILTNSLLVGFATTLLCLLIGYPVAYILSKMDSGKVLVMLFVLPMWVNFLIRTLATKTIFESIGVSMGMGTVIFGMVYNYLPFMILPLHTTLSNIDKSYAEAAKDLGADEITCFLKTTLPLSLPGIISGITMVFIPTISTFAISELLSERTIKLFGDSIFLKFNNDGTWGIGSVMSLVMIILVLLSNFLINKFNGEQSNKGRTLW